VCGWDAADGNNSIFGNHYCEHTLFEDCAGWGIARKTYTNSQGGNFTTYRRCWGRWEGCHRVGPKMTFSVYYNSYGNRFENCVGTWDARRMKETYTVFGNDGEPFTSWSQGPKEPHHQTGYAVDQPYGIFGRDRIDPGKCPTKPFGLLGCLAYLTPDQRVDTLKAMFFVSAYHPGDLTMRDCAAIAAVGSAAVKPMRLYNPLARRLTIISKVEPDFSGSHDMESIARAGDLDSLTRGPHGALDVPGGADLWHRYENGVKTGEPLWPWPMNERIKELTGVDVTATVMELAGAGLEGVR